jgi:hypothetical protein
MHTGIKKAVNVTNKLDDHEVMELLRSESPLNKARAKFSHASARIEQAGQQRIGLNPIEWRRMEFEAVGEIADALGVHIPSSEVATAPDIRFIYKNWRGETRERHVRPIGYDYGSNEWHPEPQWFLVGIDTETGEKRNFALKDIQNSCKEK